MRAFALTMCVLFGINILAGILSLWTQYFPRSAGTVAWDLGGHVILLVWGVAVLASKEP